MKSAHDCVGPYSLRGMCVTQIAYGFADLSELVKYVLNYLEKASIDTRIAAANELTVRRSEDLMGAINEVLNDPFFNGKRIAALATKLLALEISYQGDSIVYIADPDDPGDCAERALANLERSLLITAPGSLP